MHGKTTIKIHENIFRLSRVVTYQQTKRYVETNVRVYSTIHLLTANAQRKHTYGKMHLTCYVHPHTLQTSLVRTVRPLLGAHRNGQAMLYLFEKHFVC
jgi:hypothetical protein